MKLQVKISSLINIEPAQNGDWWSALGIHDAYEDHILPYWGQAGKPCVKWGLDLVLSATHLVVHSPYPSSYVHPD